MYLFLNRAYQFIGSAKEQFEVLNTMYKSLEGLYKELGKYYAFDSHKYNMEELFQDIKSFKDSFGVSVSCTVFILLVWFKTWGQLFKASLA